MKKFFAALLAMIMVLSLVPATIFAAEAVCPGEDETHNADNCVATAVETKEPVCGEWGYTIYKCDTCGAQYADNFVKGDNSHDYGEWTVVEEPTCDEVGAKVRECSICGDEDYEDIAPLGHKYETTEGIGCAAKQVCSVCGDEVEAGAHSWGSSPSAILEEPYFDAEGVAHDGLAEYTCTVCGDVKQVIIICEHEHEYELVIEAEDADCLEEGTIDVYQCKICKKYFKLVKNENEATGADGAAWADYYEEITLGESVEEGGNVIEALGHELSDPEPIEGEPCHYQVKCTREGCSYTEEMIHIHPREDVAGVYSEDPTCTKYGYELFACKNCGDTWSESTPPLGHKEVTVVVPGTCTYPGYTFTYCANGDHCDVYGPDLTETFVPDEDEAEDYYRTSNEDAIAAKLAYDVTIPVLDKDGKEIDRVGVALISVEDNKDVDAGKHYIQKDVIQAATCYASGLTVEHCILCGYHKEIVVPALGHDFTAKKDGSNVTVNAEANCTEGGSETIECANGCGLSKTFTSEALGHAWVTLASRINCKYGELADNDGVYYEHAFQKCSACDATQTVVINTWDDVTIPSYFATVEDAKYYHGNVKFEWSYDEKGNFVEKTIVADESTHTFIEGEVYNQPTCTEVGYQSYTCDDCGLSFFVEIPKLPHATKDEKDNSKAYTCFEDGIKAHQICDACGAKHIDGVAVTDDELVIPAKHLGFYGKYFTMNKVHSSCVEPDWDAFAEALEELPLDATQLEALNLYAAYGFGLTQDVTVCYTCGSLFNDEECKYPVMNIRWVVEYPGHWMEYVEGKEATCQYSGLVAGEYCVKPGCGYHTDSLANFEITFNNDETVKKVTYDQEVIPAFNHVYNPSIHGLEGSAIFELDHNDPLHGCKRADCHNDCGMEIYWHHICDICEKEWIDGYKSAAEGHTNEAGELILDICDPDEDADRHCVICDQDIAAKEHDIVEVVVEATCVADGYTLYYCKNCDYRKVIESDIDLMHPDKHPDESIVEDLESGVAYCELCGKILGKAVALIPTTDVEVVSDGATFTVQVVINATELEVWGLKFDLLYEAEVLELVDAKIASENFTYAGQINDFIYDEWLGVISVALNAEDDVLVDGEQLVLEATFKVNNPYEYETAHFATYAENDWDDPNALNKDGEPIWAIGFELEIELDLFLDVDDDGIAATMLDALAMYELILANEYYAPADTDGDGVITMVDLINLYDVIVGKTTANELLGREPVEAPEEVPAD